MFRFHASWRVGEGGIDWVRLRLAPQNPKLSGMEAGLSPAGESSTTWRQTNPASSRN